MNDFFPDISFSAVTQDDIIRKIQIVQQWWLTQGAHRYNNDDTGVIGLPACPITISCALSGEVLSVKFDDDSKKHMSNDQIGDALQRAAQSVHFLLPQTSAELSMDEQAEILLGYLKRITQKLTDLSATTMGNEPISRHSSSDHCIQVGYLGGFLCEITLLKRNWVLLASEQQIEDAIINASCRALNINDHPRYAISNITGRNHHGPYDI